MRSITILLIALLCSTCSPVYAADFDKAMDGWTASNGYHIAGTMRNEGGWCNVPGDPGGETYKGITKRDNPRWKGWAHVNICKAQLGPQPKFGTKAYYAYARNINRILKGNQNVEAYVDDFYRREYWQAIHGDEIKSQYLAFKICDFGINAGAGTSIKLLVKTINQQNGAERDMMLASHITPAMVQWLNIHTQDRDERHKFFRAYVNNIEARYQAIANHNLALKQFLGVWKKRAEDKE